MDGGGSGCCASTVISTTRGTMYVFPKNQDIGKPEKQPGIISEPINDPVPREVPREVPSAPVKVPQKQPVPA